MSIAVLHQVFDETRRLAIAGSNLAQDDFRLQKLIPPLEQSGKKAPVFAKVATAAQTLVDAKPKQSAGALLDLSSLVMAVLYTQGELGADGKLQPIKPVGIELASTQTPARLLKPVIEALTTTGSGRMETVREAYERGAFKDPRLVNHAIAGLDDVYGELADFMERKVVASYGQAIVPLIQHRINLSGRGGDARRLRLLYRLDPKTARPLVLEAFEKGSKEMKLAALACLGESKDDLPPLLEQTKAKSAEVRHVAFRRLLEFFDTPEVIDVLDASLDGKDADHIAHYFRGSKSKKLLARLVSKWNAAYGALTAIEVKQRMKPAEKKELEKTLRHALTVSHALPFSPDAKVQKIAQRVIDDCDSIVAYKGGTIDGGDLIEWASQWIAICGKPPLKKRLASRQATIPTVALDDCVNAAMDALTPKEFYDTFSPIYLEQEAAGTGKDKPSKRDLRDRREILENTLQGRSSFNVWYDPYYDDDWDESDYYDEYQYGYPRRPRDKPVTFDPRWIRDAIKRKDNELLMSIASARDKDALNYLESEAKQLIAKQKDDFYDAMHIIKKLAMCKHKGIEQLIIELLQKASETRSKAKKQPRYGYGSTYWLGQALPFLSAAQAKKVHASLEGLHESIIDEMLVALSQAEEIRSKMKKKS